jgi:hypothetical protein
MALGSVREIANLSNGVHLLFNRARHGNWVNKTPKVVLVLKIPFPAGYKFHYFKEHK